MIIIMFVMKNVLLHALTTGENLKKIRKMLISIRVPLLEVYGKKSGKTRLIYEERVKRIQMMTRKIMS